MPTTLLLGNTAVVESVRGDDGELRRTARSELGNQITTVSFPDDMGFTDRLRAVESAWPFHSDDPPEWVECDDDDALAQLVARAFSSGDHECRVGRPRGWKEN